MLADPALQQPLCFLRVITTCGRHISRDHLWSNLESCSAVWTLHVAEGYFAVPKRQSSDVTPLNFIIALSLLIHITPYKTVHCEVFEHV